MYSYIIYVPTMCQLWLLLRITILRDILLKDVWDNIFVVGFADGETDRRSEICQLPNIGSQCDHTRQLTHCVELLQ